MRPATILDAVLALSVAASAASGDLGAGRSIGDQDIALLGWDPPLWFSVPLGLLVGAAVWHRRRRPVVLLVLALVAWVTVDAFVAVVLAQYTFAERSRSRQAAAVATMVAGVVVGFPIWRLGGADAAVPLTAAICLAPALLGLYVGAHRELIAGMRERAERAEREQRERVLRARSDERAQIAQDMHDVVTHRVSLMVLHATALEASEGRDATAIGKRIGTIGREALSELRSLVDVLRTDDAPLKPQPGLADLADLVEESRRTGMDVTLRVDESEAPAPALVGHAVYRVVQEALTNVHKHAGDAECAVIVQRTAKVLRLSVTNGRAREPAAGLPSGGHGLLGIAERVRLLGGELTAGATPEGGYSVIAEVPL
ncbi:histidine kinase [Actinomadura darangshiensis]|uniref:histidine kinase n=1 Tax=Actinomadura darangshiensis TaxID=705336 RepID=A0A4R5BMA7_9ACTN|nr:histidine kinase [Actinomadura darangshiensis]TDD85014.1 histidine kinase [Actinomadura darangshiensis]